MSTVLAGVAAGFLAGRLAWLSARPLFAAAALARPNYRGHVVPTAAGLVLPVAVLLVEGGRAVVAAFGDGGDELDAPRAPVVVAAAGFALLGLVDDVAGSTTDRGFGGHLRALAHGRLTTGGLKLVGGAALALVVAAPVASGSPGRLLADAALVALAANLGNLFDRAPGRAIKVGAAAFAALAAATAWDPTIGAVAVVVGAALGLLSDDLHEQLMLGDTGANALGAVLGLGVVLACAPATRTVVLVAVAALNLAAEVVSFSRVIDAVPPLRALDRLGRRRTTAP
ncbi:MAG: hypothetical protein M3O23_00230 [Actinomycetota bacterium]|nr:hypothetical protein [Actinomycetota bacterium]